MRLFVKTAVAVAALPLLVTACSTSSGSTVSATSTTSGSTTSGSGSPAAASSMSTGGGGGGSAGGLLAGLSASQIASEATANFKAASSVHVTGTIGGSGPAEKLDLTTAPGKCAGTVSIAGSVTTFVEIGDTLWIKVGGLNQYVKTTSKNSQYQGMVGICVVTEIARVLDFPGVGKGSTSVVDGQQALKLTEPLGIGASYVTLSSTPEYVRVKVPNEQLDFSAYNAPMSVNPPPASEVISGPAGAGLIIGHHPPLIRVAAQYLGPTNSSSRATESRRATEIAVRRENRQATPSRSSVSPQSRRMSSDSLTNM
jgi:hypothetical protein